VQPYKEQLSVNGLPKLSAHGFKAGTQTIKNHFQCNIFFIVFWFNPCEKPECSISNESFSARWRLIDKADD
jgi:hypothetical protein